MYDAIVVGAGPAGNIAAYRLSKLGHKVVVLDWRQNIGDKLCTGIIGRGCLEKYPPDPGEIFREARSATVVGPSGRSYALAKKEPQAYIIDRVSFVASLARRAEDAGATYMLGARVGDIRISGRDVTVEAQSGTAPLRYRAPVLIIASGFASPLLGMAGLQNGRCNDHMVGCQAEVEVDGLEEIEVYLGEAIAPGSFGWLVPLSDSRALAGLVSRQKLNGHMGDFLSTLDRRGRVKRIIKEPQRWGIPLKPASRTYRDRVLVAGDAAGLAKPTTGGGIYYALLSGEMAADAVQQAFLADDFSARQLRRYETNWKEVFGRELRVGYYTRLLYEVLGDGQIEQLLDGFMSREVQQDLLTSNLFSFDWHSGLIMQALGHRGLGRVFQSFGLKVAPILTSISSLRPAASAAQPVGAPYPGAGRDSAAQHLR